MEVYAQQNDNLDAILYRYFGRSEAAFRNCVRIKSALNG